MKRKFYWISVLLLGVVFISDLPLSRNEGLALQAEFRPFRALINLFKKKEAPVVEAEPVKEKTVDDFMNEAIADSAWPGGVLTVTDTAKTLYSKAYGHHTYSNNEPTLIDDIFDLASISKVVGTTSAVMLLYDQGLIDLDAYVVNYIPEFAGPTPEQSILKRTVKIRHLLTHTSGLPAYRQFWRMGDTIEARVDSIFQTALDTIPGTRMVYSCVGFITLAKVVERITELPMDVFLQQNLFRPLGMKNTMYNPKPELWPRVVPTEYNELTKKLTRGRVHDEVAHSIGGVSGNAGLFSSGEDLAIFARMMLNEGIHNGDTIIQPETVKLFTNRANLIYGDSRALGWDTPDGLSSGGWFISDKAFGHTGFTGTSIWIDKENMLAVILLTNAVHPSRTWKAPKYFQWRQKIHSEAYRWAGFTRENSHLKRYDRWKE
jgi:CubicO group peptidase (beta-lactamase class C family)